MSRDPAPRRGRRRIVLAFLLLVVFAAALWAFVPRRIGPVTVERVELLPPGTPDGGSKPAALATPTRIAVTFTVPDDLAAERARLGMGYLAAQIAACDGDGGTAREVVDQRAGYLGDYGRVRRLGESGGAVRYRAVFDDELTRLEDHRSVRSPARTAAGGLCLSLYGARMWFGSAHSAPVRLDLPA